MDTEKRFFDATVYGQTYPVNGDGALFDYIFSKFFRKMKGKKRKFAIRSFFQYLGSTIDMTGDDMPS